MYGQFWKPGTTCWRPRWWMRGLSVMQVNPDLVARCGPAKIKDDAEDTWTYCPLTLDQYAGLHRLTPHGLTAAA
jgi:hypothetical protein